MGVFTSWAGLDPPELLFTALLSYASETGARMYEETRPTQKQVEDAKFGPDKRRR